MVSTNFLNGKIKRLQREISQLENKRSKAVDDEASAIKKIKAFRIVSGFMYVN